jgi:hypothetical protein
MNTQHETKKDVLRRAREVQRSWNQRERQRRAERAAGLQLALLSLVADLGMKPSQIGS